MDINAYRKEPKKVGHVTGWDWMPSPGVVQQRDNSLLACLRFRGPDLHSAQDSALVVQAQRLNNIFRRLDGGWALLTDARRRGVCTYAAPSEWPDPLSRELDAERRAHYTKPGRHYETETTLTLVYRQPPAALTGWKRLLYTNLPLEDMEQESLARFTDEIARIQAQLGPCSESLHPLAGKALLTYLKSTISMKAHQVAVPQHAHYLDTYLSDMDLTRERRLPSLLRWPKLGEYWLRCVGVKAYPQETFPGMLDVLGELQMEYRATQRYLPLSRNMAVKELRKYRKAHYGQRRTLGASAVGSADETPTLEQAALDWEREANQAQADVQHGIVNYGYLTQVVVVWDRDWKEAQAKAEAVEQALNNADFIAKVETINTMDAWIGSLPGNTVANVRRPLMHSQNVAHLIPATQPWGGPTWNSHLGRRPLLRTTGLGHTPFNVDTYEGDVGHFLGIGPTGAGKSTLANMMVAQWLERPGAQAYVFDFKESFKCLTYGVGGQWWDIGAEVGRVFNTETSLDASDFQPWASAWLPPHGRFQCFELAGLMRTPRLVAEVVRSITQTIEDQLTGAPTMIIYDEAWKYIRPLPGVDKDKTAFQERIEEGLRTARKLNACIGFFTQSLAEMEDSPLSVVLAESCPSRFFLANQHVRERKIAELYDGFGVNSRQRDIIGDIVAKRDCLYQGPRGSGVFRLELGPLALAFCGSGSKEDLAMMNSLYNGDAHQFRIDWAHYKELHMQADAWKSEGTL